VRTKFDPTTAAAVQRAKELLTSRDPDVMAEVRDANAALYQKALTPGAVHRDETLTNMSIQYSNNEYIGTRLMPVSTVNSLSAQYPVFNRRDRMAYPDDALGPRTSPNELSQNLTWKHVSLAPYGYKEHLDALTLAVQTEPLIGMVDVIAHLNDAIAFREELRIAAIVTSTASYAAGNYTTLSGGEEFSDPAVDVVRVIQGYKRNLARGSGVSRVVLATTENVITELSNHPKVKAQNDDKQADDATLARLFRVDEIIVAQAEKDTANEGQAENLQPIWPDFLALLRVADNNVRNASFGRTFRFGEKDTDQWFDPTIGARGGWYGRVSLVEGHHIQANDTGFLVTNPLG
jgi:hypothetical protein